MDHMSTGGRELWRVADDPTGRFSLNLFGGFTNDMRLTTSDSDSGGGEAFVRLTVRVWGLAFPPPYDPWVSYGQDYPELVFHLTQNPVVILQQIRRIISLVPRDEAIINCDDDEVLGFLADNVASFLRDLTASTPSAPDDAGNHISARAYLRVPGTVDISIAQLKEVTYHNKKNDDAAAPPEEEVTEIVTEKSCPICLEDFGEGEQVHLTPCGHPFHLHCLERWLRLNGRCPFCRSVMQWDVIKLRRQT